MPINGTYKISGLCLIISNIYKIKMVKIHRFDLRYVGKTYTISKRSHVFLTSFKKKFTYRLVDGLQIVRVKS